MDKKIKKIGKIGIIKNPFYHNEEGFSVKKYLKKKAYYSQNFEKYIAKWGKTDPDIRKQFGFYYRFFGVFTENGKWKKMASHPILAASMLVLRFLVGFRYLKLKLLKNSQIRIHS